MEAGPSQIGTELNPVNDVSVLSVECQKSKSRNTDENECCGDVKENVKADGLEDMEIVPGVSGVECYPAVEMEASLDISTNVFKIILPEEIWIKILLNCDVQDVSSFAHTCKFSKRIVDSSYFWRRKFFKLLQEKDFAIEDYKHFQILDLNFKDICYRFYKIFHDKPGNNLQKCTRCKRYTCLQGCVEDKCQKVAIDIGSKVTWIMTPSSELRRHQSILSIPKIVKCMDCNTLTKHRFLCLKGVCNCVAIDNKIESTLRPDRFLYTSQSLDSKNIKTCCLFCKHRIYIHGTLENHLMRGYCEELVEIGSEPSSSQLNELCNGFCADAAQQMKVHSVDFVSPALALRKGGVDLFITLAFLEHILTQCCILEELRMPYGVLILCEAVGLPPGVRHAILDYLFIQAKLSRVCVVPKPLAVCAELGLKTCIVVDSGALHTSVAVVIGGKVVLERCREVPVGGRHIAESLHNAHACDDTSQEIPVSSLDSSEVKEQCWLSYNMAAEEQRQCTVRCESIWVPAPNRRNMRIKSWKQISLGNEVYRAPEFMYVSLDLPQLILDVTKGLPEDQLKECLSHIALTGGNTCLTGFEARLRRDLAELFPEYAGLLEIIRGLGTRSSNAAVGSTQIIFPIKQGVPPQPFEPGTVCWISRDDYIFFGCDFL